MPRRALTGLAASLLAAIALVPMACNPDSLGGSGGGPPGEGGFDPGTTVGTGTSSGSTSTGGAGPVMCDDAYKICDREITYADNGESSVELRGDWGGAATWDAGAPMIKDGSTWRASIQVSWNKSFQYKFFLNGVTWIPDPANPDQAPDGFGGFQSVAAGATCDPWTCGPAPGGDDPKLADWRDEVMYFVFVDRFLDGNPQNNGSVTPGVQTPADWHGGDWAGVTQKIQEGYFNDLGVTLLWLSVPMDNTSQSGEGAGADSHMYTAYHAYWPTNLDKTEEHFGTMAELQDLVQKAHDKGLKVMLDYAMNHVHSASPVYKDHPDWFWKLSDCGVCGSNECPWDGPSGKKCWFTDYLPDFNFTNGAARAFSVDNAIWWIQQTGVDGLRLDAIKHVENSWMWDLRTAIETQIESVSGKHFYTVGETFSYNPADILKDPVTQELFVDPKKALTGQFDFPVRLKVTSTVLRREGTMAALDTFLNENDNFYGPGAVMSTFIGNHDLPRVIHQAEDTPLDFDKPDPGWNNLPGLPSGMNAFERVANGFTVLFTTKGIPLIYYGDEIGMPGGPDPDNRHPMQWTGYSAGQQFLKDHIHTLGIIRAAHPALSQGTRSKLSVSDDTYAYKMASATDTVYVAINRSNSAQSVDGLPSGSLKDLLTNTMVTGPSVNVPARHAMILVTP